MGYLDLGTMLLACTNLAIKLYTINTPIIPHQNSGGHKHVRWLVVGADIFATHLIYCKRLTTNFLSISFVGGDE
jgi:hypothetical protein